MKSERSPGVNVMKTSSLPTLGAAILVCSMFLGFSPTAVAATATNLVTICTSATTTTQAGKCTAWQYNVYSPTAYIESYPTVKPAESGINGPNYEYRLGSTITASMGVKVCPTALTPGVSFFSEQADPCPNNVLVSASTVLPASTYAVTTNADGIVVYQVSTAGVNVVPGGPFVPSPVPSDSEDGTTTPSPVLAAVDPTGQFLWAEYTPGMGSVVWSFNMVNGVLHQIASSAGPIGDCAGCNPALTQLIATAQHLYFNVSAPPARALVATTNNGVITSSFQFGFDYSAFSSSTLGPLSFAIDPQEQFLYWYASSTQGTTPDTVLIYSLNFSTASATLVEAMPLQGTLLLGAK
jgi:hypothetical protein